MANDKQSLIFKHGFNIDGVTLSDNDLGTVFFERKADDSEEGYLYFYLKDKNGNNKLYSTTSLFKDDAVMQGDVTVNKSLTVEGNTILGNSTTNETSTDDVVVQIKGNTSIGSYTSAQAYEDRDLSVYGTTTIGHINRPQDFYLYGTQTNTGDTILNGKLAINSDIDDDFHLKVDGDADISGDLNVASLYASNNLEIEGATTLTGLLKAHGLSDFYNKVYIGPNDTKPSSLGDNYLYVNGEATIANDVLLKKNVEIGTDYMNDASNGLLSIYNNTTIGTTTNSKTLTVYGNTTIGRSGKTQTFTLYGTSKLNGNSFLNGKVAINCASDTIDSNYPQLKVGGNTLITGTTSLSSTLDVTGITTLKSNLITKGTSLLNGKVYIGTTDNNTFPNIDDNYFYVNGKTTINDSLIVTGNAYLKDDVEIGISNSNEDSGSLSIYNHTTIGINAQSKTKNLTVYGNTTIGADDRKQQLDVYGNSYISGMTIIGATSTEKDDEIFKVNGYSILNGNLEVQGTTNLNSSLSVNGANTTLGKDLIVNGTSLLEGKVYIGEVNPDAIPTTATEKLYVDGTLRTTNNATFNKNVSIGADYENAQSDANTGVLRVYNNTIIGQDSANGTLDKTFTVYGISYLKGNTVVGLTSNKKTLTVNGNLEVYGDGNTITFGKERTTKDASGTITAQNNVVISYSAGSSGDTLTITFND